MLVSNYKSMLHNILEELRSHLYHNGSLKSYTRMCSLHCFILDFSFVFRYPKQCIHISPFWTTFMNHTLFDRQYVNLTLVLSIIHQHIQCSPDGQPQIINYISLLVAAICFRLLHYPFWGPKFSLLCFTIVYDISKNIPLQFLYTLIILNKSVLPAMNSVTKKTVFLDVQTCSTYT
jgi:hypothetical protein